MSKYFRYPMPNVQALGVVSIPTCDQPDAPGLPKPVAAAVLTMTQRDDGHVMIFHDVMSAEEETQFPLCWLIEQALITGATTLVDKGEAQILLLDASQQRFFVEPKLAALFGGERAIDAAALAGNGVSESVLCRRLNIPRLGISLAEAGRLWANSPRSMREVCLGQYALADAVSRLMLWANLISTRTAEPGWFYETMLALRCWLDERERNAPALFSWGTSKPIMRAVSFAEDYRRDQDRRSAGLDSDWPVFEPNLFHS